MIEIPRAALTADEIAKEAEFFCFGTNDLTQMTFGFSRDDAGKFLDAYYDAKIFENDPFAKLDQVGVGRLMDMAVKLGKQTRPFPALWHLRRARRRSQLCRVLQQAGPGLCILLTLPRADCQTGCSSTGSDRSEKRIIAEKLTAPCSWNRALFAQCQWHGAISGRWYLTYLS